MTRRPTHPLHRPGGRCLHCDERGVFPVVEAILVAVLVLTAILFFTSVQRPTTGAEEGGIDLAQVAADSLQLMQSGEQGGLSFEEWVTALVDGDASVATAVDRYLVGTSGDGILPKGARYQLRLDNGVSSIPLLPTGGADAPRGARASQVTLLPDWAAYKDEPASWKVSPGEVIPAGDPRLPLVDTTTAYQCLQSPTGQSMLVDLGDSLDTADTWIDHWKAVPPVANALTPPVLWKRTQNQVPSDILYGTWAAYTDAACTAGATHFRVVRPDDSTRTGTATTAQDAAALTASTVPFTSADVGLPITGIVLSDGSLAFPEGTTILAFVSATAVTLSQNAVVDASDVFIVVGASSPYVPYGLQLVVWFGA